MENKHSKFLPKVNGGRKTNNKRDSKSDIVGNSPCPCCGFITIPYNGDALAYICPVCFWEIDLFIQSIDEISDQNHGLTLNEARRNYQQFGAVLPNKKKYCRQPKKMNIQQNEAGLLEKIFLNKGIMTNNMIVICMG